MFKYLEVGSYVFAGIMVCILGYKMTDTQETLKPVQLDQIAPVAQADVPKLGANVVPNDVMPEDRQVKNCFKHKQCSKLAEVIYFEDRSDVRGMKAVANVVMNRTKSDKYPDTVVEVVNQKKRTHRGWVCQFSYMCQLKDRRMTDDDSKYKAGLVAWKAINGKLHDNTNGAVYYYNPSKVKRKPKFAKEYTRVATISDHVFYRSLQ